MVDLRALPDDQNRRNEALDRAAARPGPETRKPLPGKLHTVETGAATAAAVLGMLFSTSSNVLLGASAPIEENALVDPNAAQRPVGTRGAGDKGEDGESDAEDKAPPADTVDASHLVPWVELPSGAPPPQ